MHTLSNLTQIPEHSEGGNIGFESLVKKPSTSACYLNLTEATGLVYGRNNFDVAPYLPPSDAANWLYQIYQPTSHNFIDPDLDSFSAIK